MDQQHVQAGERPSGSWAVLTGAQPFVVEQQLFYLGMWNTEFFAGFSPLPVPGAQ